MISAQQVSVNQNITLLLIELAVNGPKGFRKFLCNRCTKFRCWFHLVTVLQQGISVKLRSQ